MKRTAILFASWLIIFAANAQQCRVQGIVQYYYNEYIGYKADCGAEVMFIKYSSALKLPTRSTWETYQDLVDRWIKASYYYKHFGLKEACEKADFKKEDRNTIQELGLKLAVEKNSAIENGLVKYTTIVDGGGMYDITVPYGIYYILIKSKNRNLPTVLEHENRYQMIRVDLKSPTKVISYDFNIPLNNVWSNMDIL